MTGIEKGGVGTGAGKCVGERRVPAIGLPGNRWTGRVNAAGSCRSADGLEPGRQPYGTSVNKAAG